MANEKMNSLRYVLKEIGIVPVVVLDNKEDAVPLGKALMDGGLPCAEVTFRTEAAADTIQILSKAYPDMLVGAGTVLTIEQADRAIAAGAKFIVSPGFNAKVVEHCLKCGIPMIPGICTPSELEAALEFGIDVVKFFPAEAAGGLDYIKAIAAPYANVYFMPTGGINCSNIQSYLEYDRVIACGGSWMVNKKLIHNKDYGEITNLVKEAASTVKKMRHAEGKR